MGYPGSAPARRPQGPARPRRAIHRGKNQTLPDRPGGKNQNPRVLFRSLFPGWPLVCAVRVFLGSDIHRSGREGEDLFMRLAFSGSTTLRKCGLHVLHCTLVTPRFIRCTQSEQTQTSAVQSSHLPTAHAGRGPKKKVSF